MAKQTVNDDVWPFGVAAFAFWSSVILILYLTKNPILLLIIGLPLLYFYTCLALLYMLSTNSVFKDMPFYKKVIASFCIFLAPITRFRYWVLKDMSPGITFEEYQRIPFWN